MAQSGGTVEWEPPEGFEPIEAIIRSLVAKADGIPVIELEMQYAAMFLCAQALVARGVNVDTAIKACEQASDHGSIHIIFSETEGLTVIIGEDNDA